MSKPKRNIKLTASQQASVDRMKAVHWRRDSKRLLALPPPTAEEVARLVEEFERRRGVTVCPATASPERSYNGGAGWW